MDVVKGDMEMVEVKAEDRVRWRQMVRCGAPCREQPKEEEFSRADTPLIMC